RKHAGIARTQQREFRWEYMKSRKPENRDGAAVPLILKIHHPRKPQQPSSHVRLSAHLFCQSPTERHFHSAIHQVLQQLPQVLRPRRCAQRLPLCQSPTAEAFWGRECHDLAGNEDRHISQLEHATSLIAGPSYEERCQQIASWLAASNL